jgi:hypothetical protein
MAWRQIVRLAKGLMPVILGTGSRLFGCFAERRWPRHIDEVSALYCR